MNGFPTSTFVSSETPSVATESTVLFSHSCAFVTATLRASRDVMVMTLMRTSLGIASMLAQTVRWALLLLARLVARFSAAEWSVRSSTTSNILENLFTAVLAKCKLSYIRRRICDYRNRSLPVLGWVTVSTFNEFRVDEQADAPQLLKADVRILSPRGSLWPLAAL